MLVQRVSLRPAASAKREAPADGIVVVPPGEADRSPLVEEEAVGDGRLLVNKPLAGPLGLEAETAPTVLLVPLASVREAETGANGGVLSEDGGACILVKDTDLTEVGTRHAETAEVRAMRGVALLPERTVRPVVGPPITERRDTAVPIPLGASRPRIAVSEAVAGIAEGGLVVSPLLVASP